MRFSRWWVTTISVVAACTDDSPPPDESNTRRAVDRGALSVSAKALPSDTTRAVPHARGIVLWTREPSVEPAQIRSFWVEPAAAGHRVATALEGVFVASRRGVLHWTTESVPVPIFDCDVIDDENAQPISERGTATRALVTHDGGERVVIVDDVPTGRYAAYEHRVELLASVGPYLFIRETTMQNGCGAHGNVEVSFFVWDTDARAVRADVLPLIEHASGVERQRARLQLIEDARSEDPDENPFVSHERIEALPLDAVSLVAIVPRLDGERLVVEQLYSTDACYACGDDVWGSYTRTTMVTASIGPSILEPYRNAPPELLAFARAHPRLEIGGYAPLQ